MMKSQQETKKKDDKKTRITNKTDNNELGKKNLM